MEVEIHVVNEGVSGYRTLETGRQQLCMVQASKSEVMVIQTNANSGSRLIIMLNRRAIRKINHLQRLAVQLSWADATFRDVDSLEKLVPNIPSHS